ncbi:MAG: NTP transferase domain-containing protein [Planctomycetota bacterium]
MSIVAIVPARLESSRLPRKMILAETGRPLVVETAEAVRACGSIDRVCVATDSAEISTACRRHNIDCVVTGPAATGTDRVAAAADLLYSASRSPQTVLNVQGDEPDVSAATIESVCKAAETFPLVTARAGEGEGVAVVGSPEAAGFIRGRGRRHVGIYCFGSPRLLQKFRQTPRTEAELAAELEQLRVFAWGAEVQWHVVDVDHPWSGINTRADYDAFVARRRQAGAA